MWGQVRELSGGSSWVGGNLIYQDLTASFLSCRWWILVCSHQATSVNAFVSLTKSPFWKSHFPRLNPVNSLVFSSVTIRLSKTFIWVFPYSLTEETMNFLVNSISREFQKKKKGFHLNLYAKFMSDMRHLPLPSEGHLGWENMFPPWKKGTLEIQLLLNWGPLDLTSSGLMWVSWSLQNKIQKDMLNWPGLRKQISWQC